MTGPDGGLQREPASRASAWTAGVRVFASSASESMRLAAIGCGELVALFAVHRIAGPSVSLLVATHLVCVTLAAAIAMRTYAQGEAVTFLSLGVLVGIVMGPLGFLGAALLGLSSRAPDLSSPLVAQWYERIALSTTVPPDERLCEDVDVGRTLDADAPAPASFPALMRSGTLERRQAILGHIARRFDLAYLPTLKIALASPEPVVRVQAAAVAAHIGVPMRRLLRDRVAKAGRAPSDVHDALGLFDDLSLLIDSGLLDASERRQAEALARRLADIVAASVERKPLIIDPVGNDANGMRLIERLDQILIERRRFSELRAQRTAVRIRQHHPFARLRKLTVSTRTSGVLR